MKKTVKRFSILAAVVLVLAALLIAYPALADSDRPLTVQELPAASQQLLQQAFPESRVAYAKVSNDWFEKEYKVVFVDGSKVEFDRRGEWKQIECKYGQVPPTLVPQPILDRVQELFGTCGVISIERDRRGYEVKLDNRVEASFDKAFRMVDLDD